MTAPDAMGHVARKAALAETRLGYHLNAAASAELSREDRATHAERAFAIWYPLCKAMSELEATAPNAARKAREHHDRIVDFVQQGPPSSPITEHAGDA